VHVFRSGKETQAVPPLSPHIADAGRSVQDERVDSRLSQEVANRKAGLAGTDDNDPFVLRVNRHRSPC
jgi:hypothetical protein